MTRLHHASLFGLALKAATAAVAMTQITSPGPPAPQLRWPRDRVEMTDVASVFR